MVSFKKYVPSLTQAIQVTIVVTIVMALGVTAWSSNWVRTHVLGRV